MRVALINQVLMLAVKQANVQAAILGRGDKGVSLLHIAHKLTGLQGLFAFKTRDDIRQLEENEVTADATIYLGFYTVAEAAWSLANLASHYEAEILALEKRFVERQKTLSEQLIERLIAASTCVSDPAADLPEGHELWRLCLAGNEQEVFVPSAVEGSLSMLPGIVLADLTAPKGMPSVIAMLIAKERELERMRQEAHETLHQNAGSLVTGILRSVLGNKLGDDLGFGRGFGTN